MASQDDSWDENKDDSGGPATITPEDQEILDAVRASGISAGELVSRAKRDYETQREAAGTDDSKNSNSDDDPVTKKDMQKVEENARQAARLEMITANNEKRIADRIDGITKSKGGLGKNVSIGRMKAIQQLVSVELHKNINLRTLDEDKFMVEVDRITKDVVADELKEAREITGADEQTDMESRLNAQATAPNSGSKGGVSNKSSASFGDGGREFNSDENTDPDNPTFGVGTHWPTIDEADRIRDKEMEDFHAKAKAGR